MKRSSEIIYTYLDNSKTEFHLTPKFNFTENATRLVDYSFTDVSDSDDDCHDEQVDPLQKLQSDLDLLKSKLGRVHCIHRSQILRSKCAGSLKVRASRRLKAEEDNEKQRNDHLVQRLNHAFCETTETTDLPSSYQLAKKLKTRSRKTNCHVYDTERLSKKRIT